MDFLPEWCRLELRRVDGGFDAFFFAVARLESRSVLTLGYVDVCIVVAATRVSVNFYVDVFMVAVREVDVNVCTRVSSFRSAEREKKLADAKEEPGQVQVVVSTELVRYWCHLAKLIHARRRPSLAWKLKLRRPVDLGSGSEL